MFEEKLAVHIDIETRLYYTYDLCIHITLPLEPEGKSVRILHYIV